MEAVLNKDSLLGSGCGKNPQSNSLPERGWAVRGEAWVAARPRCVLQRAGYMHAQGLRVSGYLGIWNLWLGFQQFCFSIVS